MSEPKSFHKSNQVGLTATSLPETFKTLRMVLLLFNLHCRLNTLYFTVNTTNVNNNNPTIGIL